MHKLKLVLDLENYGYPEALNFRHLLTANINLDGDKAGAMHEKATAAQGESNPAQGSLRPARLNE